MNKNSKLTIMISFSATVLVVAFLLNKPNDTSANKSHEEISKNIKVDSDHDHTITADMHVHADGESAPIIKVSRDGVEAESEKWETEFFNNYIDETLTNLPNLEQAKDLKDKDVHQAPAFIMEAGLRLGKIKKQVKMNRAFTPKALGFYHKCAAKEDGFTPIRGLCLANLIYMKKHLGETIDQNSYPQKVRNMAKKAMELQF